MFFFVHHDGLHIGRRQRADHELGRILAPQHDVDTLAGQLVGHGRHAAATHADAGADRIDALVMRHHGDLGTAARIAGAGFDLQQALLDLGHLLAEQLDHEFGRGARQQDRSPTQGGIHFHDHGADTVTGAEVFLGDGLVAAQAAFHAAAFDDQVALVHALDGAGEDLLATLHEFAQQHFALGIADTLQHDLLGRHGTDAADRHRLDLLLDEVAHGNVGDAVLRVHQQLFRLGILQAGLVGHDQPAAEGFVFAAFTVDGNADIHLALVQLLGGLGQRHFDGAEHHVTLDVLFAGDRLDQHQQFAVHCGLLRILCVVLGTGLFLCGLGSCRLAAALEIDYRRQAGFAHFIEHESQGLQRRRRLLLAHALAGLDRRRIAPDDLPAGFGLLQRASEFLAVGRNIGFVGADRLFQRDVDFFAHETQEIVAMTQQAVDAGRGNFKTVVVDTVHLQRVLQLARDLLAVLDGDELLGQCGLLGRPGQINGDAQQSPRRALDLDQIQTQPLHCLLDQTL